MRCMFSYHESRANGVQAYKVKANIKSELIIQQLSSLQVPKKTR